MPCGTGWDFGTLHYYWGIVISFRLSVETSSTINICVYRICSLIQVVQAISTLRARKVNENQKRIMTAKIAAVKVFSFCHICVLNIIFVLHNQLFFLHTTLLLILLAATAPFPTDRSDGNMLLCDPCKDEFMKYGDNNHVKVVFSSPSEVSNNMQK